MSIASVILRLLPYSRSLGLLLYFIGLVYFTILTNNEFNHGVYMSENALLTGLVEEEFKGEADIDGYYNTLKNFHEADNDEGMRKWLYNEMKSIGLDTAIQNFTFDFPELIGKNPIFGYNTYGILRSPGTARTESIVIASPLRTKLHPEHSTSGGVAMLLGLAKFWRRQTYIAKDIVFLFTEMEYVGMQAWMDAYHGTQASPYIQTVELEERSGSIQAGFCLEIAGPRLPSLEVKIEGLNGILPNLDLVNAVGLLSQKQGLPLRFQNKPQIHFHTNTMAANKRSIITTSSLMTRLATGSPSGLHGILLNFQIPALTLAAAPSQKANQQSLYVASKLVEGLFRCLNNLQERLHQSFYFYLLPNLGRYISIGVYTPPYIILYFGLVLHVLDLWQRGIKSMGATDESNGNATEDNRSFKTEWGFLLWETSIVTTVAFFLGLIVCKSGHFLMRLSQIFHADHGVGMFMGLACMQFIAVMIPFIIKRKQKFTVTLTHYYFLKCTASLAVALLVGCLGILNISMAMALALPLVPVTLLVSATSNRFLHFLTSIMVICVSPFSLLATGCFLHSFLLSGNGPLQSFMQLAKSINHSLVQVWIEAELLGSWTYGIMTLAVLPAWILLWTSVRTRPHEIVQSNSEKKTN